jgi:hypothetical protein
MVKHYDYDAMITDFCVGLENNKRCGTGINEGDMIKHLKKLNKSNGFKTFSIIVPEKYIKYIRGDFQTQPIPQEVLDDYSYDYKRIYKNALMVYKSF